MTAGESENLTMTVEQAQDEVKSDAAANAMVAVGQDESEDDSPDLPTFAEEREVRLRLQEREDKVEDWLEENLKSPDADHGGKDEEQRMPDVLENIDQYKRIKDSQISNALPDLCQQAGFHKDRGNEMMKDGKFLEACNAYAQGIDLFKDFTKAMFDHDAKRLAVALYSNSSQALLKLEDVQDASTEGARTMADKALELEPTNTKALFRRGMAYAKGGDTNLALDDFQQVLRLDPDNAAARKEIRAIQAARREERRAKEETPEQKAVRLEAVLKRMVDARAEAGRIRDQALTKVKDAEHALTAAQNAANKAQEELLKAQKQTEDAETAAKEARRLANGES